MWQYRPKTTDLRVLVVCHVTLRCCASGFRRFEWTRRFHLQVPDSWKRRRQCPKQGNHQWRTEGGFRVFKPHPKFRSFDKAEPNSQFRGKYIRNNLTRIRLSLTFLVVSWKALPASYDPHSGIFFLSKAWCDVSIKYQKLRKFYHMKWNFLYQITAASRTPN